MLAVGDALHTDIAGAAAVDVASCWVLGGVHGETLAAGPDGYDTAKAEAVAAARRVAAGRDRPAVFAW